MQHDVTYRTRVFVAGKRFWDTMSSGALVLLLLISFSGQISRLLDDPRFYRSDVPVVHLEVVSLEFFDGLFHQLVVPVGGDLVQARWTASIWRNQDFICGYFGWAPYRPKAIPSRFTPDNWTGDDCGALVVGQRYRAVASWTYVGADRETYTVPKQFEFIYAGPPNEK
tara:strand:+ start:12987 stop:13490 length:504 start_codon:yes stop_codon:yes gene_type:complete